MPSLPPAPPVLFSASAKPKPPVEKTVSDTASLPAWKQQLLEKKKVESQQKVESTVPAWKAQLIEKKQISSVTEQASIPNWKVAKKENPVSAALVTRATPPPPPTSQVAIGRNPNLVQLKPTPHEKEPILKAANSKDELSKKLAARTANSESGAAPFPRKAAVPLKDQQNESPESTLGQNSAFAKFGSRVASSNPATEAKPFMVKNEFPRVVLKPTNQKQNISTEETFAESSDNGDTKSSAFQRFRQLADKEGQTNALKSVAVCAAAKGASEHFKKLDSQSAPAIKSPGKYQYQEKATVVQNYESVQQATEQPTDCQYNTSNQGYESQNTPYDESAQAQYQGEYASGGQDYAYQTEYQAEGYVEGQYYQEQPQSEYPAEYQAEYQGEYAEQPAAEGYDAQAYAYQGEYQGGEYQAGEYQAAEYQSEYPADYQAEYQGEYAEQPAADAYDTQAYQGEYQANEYQAEYVAGNQPELQEDYSTQQQTPNEEPQALVEEHQLPVDFIQEPLEELQINFEVPLPVIESNTPDQKAEELLPIVVADEQPPIEGAQQIVEDDRPTLEETPPAEEPMPVNEEQSPVEEEPYAVEEQPDVEEKQQSAKTLDVVLDDYESTEKEPLVEAAYKEDPIRPKALSQGTIAAPVPEREPVGPPKDIKKSLEGLLRSPMNASNSNVNNYHNGSSPELSTQDENDLSRSPRMSGKKKMIVSGNNDLLAKVLVGGRPISPDKGEGREDFLGRSEPRDYSDLLAKALQGPAPNSENEAESGDRSQHETTKKVAKMGNNDFLAKILQGGSDISNKKPTEAKAIGEIEVMAESPVSPALPSALPPAPAFIPVATIQLQRTQASPTVGGVQAAITPAPATVIVPVLLSAQIPALAPVVSHAAQQQSPPSNGTVKGTNIDVTSTTKQKSGISDTNITSNVSVGTVSSEIKKKKKRFGLF